MWPRGSRSDSVSNWRTDSAPVRVDHFATVLNAIKRVYELDTTSRVLPFHEVRSRTEKILLKKLDVETLPEDAIELLNRNHTILAQMVVNNPIIRVADNVIRNVLKNYVESRHKGPPTFRYVISMYHEEITKRFGLSCATNPTLLERACPTRVEIDDGGHTVTIEFEHVTMWAAFLAHRSLWTCCIEQPAFDVAEVGFRRQTSFHSKFNVFKLKRK